MGGYASLRPATVDQAAQAFAACAGLDPEGKATPDSAARAGESFKVSTDTGEAIYTITARPGGRCWIHGAAGTGTGMTAAGLACIERQALAAGCVSVAFQTVRHGLVRRARALGYRITAQVGRGFIIEKRIT